MKANNQLIALILSMGFSFAAMAQEAGKVSRISGQATITSASNQTKELKRDDAVSVGDTISTTKDSQVWFA